MGKPDKNFMCKEAEQYYYDFICNESRQLIPNSIVNHIEQCQACRQHIEQLKKILSETEDQSESGQKQTTAAITKCLELHFVYIGKHVTCREVRPFLPALLDPHLKIRIPTPITVHRDNCKQCREDLETIRKLHLDRDQLWQLAQILTGQLIEDSSIEQAKMQQLNKIASQIAEQPESDTVTIYNIDKSAKSEDTWASDELYGDFPIKVEVINREDEVIAKQPASTFDFTVALKQRISARNLKSLLKPAIAAAAVILIGVTLLLNTPTAGAATTIDKIYKALEKVKNIYIASFVPDKKEPIQEKWVSRTSNNYMTKTEKELVLWDIPNRVEKLKHADTNLIGTTLLSDEVISKIEETITGFWGLVPFADLSVIPDDAEWSRVADDSLETIVKGTEVYDLTWIEKRYSGSDTFKKWRVFVNPETNLPKRTEFYKKLADGEYILRLVKIVEYLSDSEMQAVIREASF